MALVSRTSAENEVAAQSEAAALLASLSLPPGATPSATEPAGADSQLASPFEHPNTPSLVDDHSWWVVPGTPTEVLTYIRAHLAGSVRRSGHGYSPGNPAIGEPRVESETYAFPSGPSTASSRSLLVAVVRLPNGWTALRVDAQVVWLVPRSASEVIPTGAHLLRISVHGGLKRKRPRRQSLTVTSSKKIEAVVTALNLLPVIQPGVRSCPVDFGIYVELSFCARRLASPVAVADVDADGCGYVALTIRGQAQEGLERGGWVITKVDHVLGVSLDVAPPKTRHVSMSRGWLSGGDLVHAARRSRD